MERRPVNCREIIENSNTNGVGYRSSDSRIPRGLLDKSEFSVQLDLASMEFKSASLFERKQIREDINRMRVILERYQKAGCLHLIARDFPTAQSIADALSNMSYQATFNEYVEQRGRDVVMRIYVNSGYDPLLKGFKYDKINSFTKV